MSFLSNDESITEIIKSIDCIQETQQHSVVIEHNWSIDGILDLITSKKPGEKFESEQFNYKSSSSKASNKSSVDGSCQDKNKCKLCNSGGNKTNQTKENLFTTPTIPTSSLTLYDEFIYDYFLNGSQWRLEISKSLTDLNYISVAAILQNNLEKSNKLSASLSENILFKICQNIDKNKQIMDLKLKLKFYLLDETLNQLFEKKSLETNINLKKFFYTLLISCKHNSVNSSKNLPKKSKVVDRFVIDKFCKIKDLLVWLNNSKSEDFCLLTNFNVYSQSDTTSSDLTSEIFNDTKSRIKTKLNNYHLKRDTDSCSSSTSSSSPSPSLSAKSTSFIQNTDSSNVQKSSILIANYKHGWMIKSWRNFLMPGSTSHTFMNDIDISNIFSFNKNQISNENNTSNYDSIKFGKFRSKLFNLTINNASNLNEDISENSSKNKVESLLKNVKWKLQLYPNGYSTEFENNLSLFVNFSQLTGDLADFSTGDNNKKSSGSLTSTFYDSNDQLGIILLIKSPSSSLSSISSLSCSSIPNLNDYCEDEEMASELLNNSDDQIKKKTNNNGKKKYCKLNPCETFVKASFQISILDSNGKRVDKCQSEKQLFELFGSWGYKEYMNVNDLSESKEKYLTNGFGTLNLNCKIILFYTITVKSYTSDATITNTPVLLTNNENILMDIPINLTSSNSIATLLDTNSYSCIKLKNYSKSYLKKNLFKINSLKECNSLSFDLRRLLTQSNMYDLTIQAPIRSNFDFSFEDLERSGNLKQFKVHKLILSIRSEVFEKMFDLNVSTNSSINTNNVLNIVDFDAFTVETFLKYLYTDVLEVNVKNFKSNLKFLKQSTNDDCEQELEDKILELRTTNNQKPRNKSNIDEEESNELKKENRLLTKELYTHLFIELFKISDKYCVYRLKQISEMQLIKLISSENLVELMILAYLHNSSKLKNKCFDYLAQHVTNVITQSSWSYLEKNYPKLVAETFRILYFKEK